MITKVTLLIAAPPGGGGLLAACEGTLRLSVFLLAHSHPFGFVSDFELRISDFRLRRAALSVVELLRFVLSVSSVSSVVSELPDLG